MTLRAVVRRAAVLLSVACLWALGTGDAGAQNCWSNGAQDLNFGTVTASAPTDTQTTANLTCQGGDQALYVRYCVYVNESSPIGGVTPRWMTNYNGAQMAYNVYSNPARTEIIGPPPAGAGYSLYSGTLLLPVNGQSTVNIPIYGRVPAGQVLPATHGFQAQVAGSQIQWAIGSGNYPASCLTGTTRGTATFHMGVRATYSNACIVSVSSSDLDFGSATSLASTRDSTSTITLSCPPSTSWRLGLNNGQNASGTQRRMAGPPGEYVRYELYRDAGRTQRWGNDTASGSDTVSGSGSNPATATVYGRVPVQPAASPGSYVDTITVTLTY